MNQQETILIGGPVKVADPQTASFLIALLFFVVGSSLAVAGVYVLFGIGCALVTAAVPVLILAIGMFRGLTRGG